MDFYSFCHFWATVCKTGDRCYRSVVCLSVTFVHCCQTVGRIKTKLGMQVGLVPGHIVLGGDPAAPPKFSAYVYCGQTAGWVKLVLGMLVGLILGDFVIDGAQKSGQSPLPNFRPILIVAKGVDASKCHMVWMSASAQGSLC